MVIMNTKEATAYFCNRQIKDQSEAIKKVYPNPMNKEIGTSHNTLQRFESKAHLYNP